MAAHKEQIVNEREIDQALEAVFQTALTLNEDNQEALWARLAAQVEREQVAWMAFAAVMLRLNTRLQPAINCVTWPVRIRTYLS